ncbi:MAG: Cdc6/Cdc18 family protein [Candidatus Heimdallarchaeota archaeon]
MTRNPLSLIFKDESVFAADYLPDELPGRHGQLQELFKKFRPVMHDPRRAHQEVMLEGPIGSGKTTLLCYFLRSILQFTKKAQEVQFTAFYLNCRKMTSPSRLLAAIIQHADPSFPTQGLSLDELLQSVVASYTDHRLHLILCLDEFDALLDKHARHELLYSLVRLADDTLRFKMRLSLFLGTTDQKLPAMSDAWAVNILKCKPLFLPAYTVAQLEAILTQRASIGLIHHGVERGVLSTIARTVAQQGGGARAAIELLWHAGNTAASSGATTITLQHLVDSSVQWREADATPEDYVAFS